MPKVEMYTTSTCVYCRAEKEFLRQHNVAFDEHHADADPAAAEELFKLSGQYAVPFTVITKDDGTKDQILGYDQPRIAAALGL